MPTALLGLCPFGAFSASRSATRFRARSNPRTVSPSGYTMPLSRQGRPRKTAVSGLMPAQASSGQNDEGLVHRPAGCSLGVHPLRVLRRMSCPGFRPELLPRAFRRVAPENDANRRHLGVSIDIRPAATSCQNKPTWSWRPFQGSAPPAIDLHSESVSPGLFFCLTAGGHITVAHAADL